MDILMGAHVITQRGNLLVQQAGSADHIIGYMRNGLKVEEMFESLSLREDGCVLCRFAKFNAKEKNYDCFAHGMVTIKDLLLEELGRHCKAYKEDRRKLIQTEIAGELASLKYMLGKLISDFDPEDEPAVNAANDQINRYLERLQNIILNTERECSEALDAIAKVDLSEQ